MAHAEYDFFVHPIGQLAARGICDLIAQATHADPDETIEKLDGSGRAFYPITRDLMFTIYRSKRGDYQLRRDYLLYRRNRDNGKVTPVPETVFEVARPTRQVKKARAGAGKRQRHPNSLIEGLINAPGVTYRKY